MRAVIQLVREASVTVEGKPVSSIGPGLLVLLGIKKDDTEKEQDYLIKKIVNLRVFPDEQSCMNKSVGDVEGEILLVSQFTLYGDCKKGNRPSFVDAMAPQTAKEYYDRFAASLKAVYPKVKEGVFGASMQVRLLNDGPVTIVIDTAK